MFELAQQDTSVLPFLQSGLRLFEEFPAEECGLTRTEHCILDKARAGVSQLVHFFSAVQARSRSTLWGTGLFGNVCGDSWKHYSLYLK